MPYRYRASKFIDEKKSLLLTGLLFSLKELI